MVGESKERLPRAAGAILAHLLFVVIHPFRDGNGRMARMLADRYLAEASRYMFRPYSLSVEIGRHKAEYYMALESITEARGMSRFLDFMLAMHATAIDVAIERAKLLERVHAFHACGDHREYGQSPGILAFYKQTSSKMSKFSKTFSFKMSMLPNFVTDCFIKNDEMRCFRHGRVRMARGNEAKCRKIFSR